MLNSPASADQQLHLDAKAHRSIRIESRNSNVNQPILKNIDLLGHTLPLWLTVHPDFALCSFLLSITLTDVYVKTRVLNILPYFHPLTLFSTLSLFNRLTLFGPWNVSPKTACQPSSPLFLEYFIPDDSHTSLWGVTCGYFGFLSVSCQKWSLPGSDLSMTNRRTQMV